MMENQASSPVREASARSRLVMVPTSKRSPGWSWRTTSIIAGDRSMSNASGPMLCRWAVSRPGPQPTSGTGPSPWARTSSAKSARMPRWNGSLARASRSMSA